MPELRAAIGRVDAALATLLEQRAARASIVQQCLAACAGAGAVH
ncbi:hypothetical protein [Nonomuraea sp. 10N515B]